MMAFMPAGEEDDFDSDEWYDEVSPPVAPVQRSSQFDQNLTGTNEVREKFLNTKTMSICAVFVNKVIQ